MARKRRRGGSAGKQQSKLKSVPIETNSAEIVYEDDATGTVATLGQTPSSDTSNFETRVVTEGVHKKFGKFRCVIEESREPEDPLKIDSTNESSFQNSEENIEVKSFIESEMYTVEVQENGLEVVNLEENSVSSDQCGAVFITVDSSEKSTDSSEEVVNSNFQTEILTTNVLEISDSIEIFNDEDDNPQSLKNDDVFQINDQIEMEVTEVVDTEPESNEITNQLSNLNVNEEKTDNILNQDEDSQKSNVIMCEIENLGSELIIGSIQDESVSSESDLNNLDKATTLIQTEDIEDILEASCEVSHNLNITSNFEETQYTNESVIKDVISVETKQAEECFEPEKSEKETDENSGNTDEKQKENLEVMVTENVDENAVNKKFEFMDVTAVSEKSENILDTSTLQNLEKINITERDGKSPPDIFQEDNSVLDDSNSQTNIEDKINISNEINQSDEKIEQVDVDSLKNVEEENETKNNEIEENTEKNCKPQEKNGKKQIKTKSEKPKKSKESKKKKKISMNENDENTNVRRSSRIKLIDNKPKEKPQLQNKLKSSTKSKKNSLESESSENSNSGNSEPGKNSSEVSNSVSDTKLVKVKSRWRKSSELEMVNNELNKTDPEKKTITPEEEIKQRLKQYIHLKDNSYLTDRVCCKEAKKMVCDCFLTQDEIDQGEYGCGEDCLNRLLMIECGGLCSLGDRCTNKRFQKSKISACEVFRTDKKGLGVRATKLIPEGEFILEYVGEVIDPDEFENRATVYSQGKNSHFYFMALRSDAVIDATQKGNISRFINHSCEPNAETQKWTVNGELRIGFFSKKDINIGEEITFDYHFQRYGKEAQKCFCEAPTCRGWLGEEPDEDDEEEEEEDEDEEQIDKHDDVKDKKGKSKRLPKKSTKKITIADDSSMELEDSTEDDSKQITEEIEDQVKSKTKDDNNKKIIVRNKLIKPNKILEKTRKELFDDSDLNEEIQMLMSSGLKNQAHTLKLSRLMVRAREITQKSNLLRVLRRGEFPCRRLFLDYHGLRLIHGWMTDAQRNCKQDLKQESLRLEILQTLATLPIPNKTMLQDSKVLLTVQKWSIPLKKDEESNSDSNSPKLENEDKVDDKISVAVSSEIQIKEEIKTESTECEEPKTADEDDDVRKSVGLDFENISKNQDKNLLNMLEKVKVCHFSNLFEDDIFQIIEKEMKPIVPEYEVEIVALALKLLEEWSTLKEVFRIPKKERIERMKEHEREANRGYKPTVDLDLERKRSLNRYRQLQRPSRFELAERVRKQYQLDHRIPTNPFKYNKFERRKLFAMQVEQEEEEKRRKMLGKQEIAVLGTDLRLGPQHDVKFQYMWNPQTGQWQKVQILNPTPTLPPLPHKSASLTQGAPRLPYPFSCYSPSLPSTPHQLHPLASPYPPVAPFPPGISQAPGVINQVPLPGNPHLPPLPTIPALEDKLDDPSQVRFAGPIPPPVKLPPKWKSAKDKYGRPYYYHVKIRISQWEPPEFPVEEESEDEESSDTTSSSDTSSLSSDSSSEDSDSDEDEVDDTKLMLEIKKNLKSMESKLLTESDENGKLKDDKEGISSENLELADKKQSLEERLKVEFNFMKGDKEPPVKRRRSGLVTEVHIISPRTEEDKILAKENLKKYKENKEKLKRQKEIILKKVKQTAKEKTTEQQPKKRIRVTVKNPKHKKHKEKTKISDVDSETAKKIKENFRSCMATVMVSILNPFRKAECKEGHISNNEDFKHLARKLTHFVMVKELKHCKSIEDLTCTDSVKNKAREFVRKYMSKFGEKYVRPADEMEY